MDSRGARVGTRRWPLVLGVTAVAVVLVAGGSGAYLHSQLRASLPQLEGEREVRGLGAPVRIERDALGVPVVRGGSRLDVARATGFLHAQERFFQMDLLRRSAAGELADLVGRGALEMDREIRPLRLRLVARRAVEALRADERDLLAAYADGRERRPRRPRRPALRVPGPARARPRSGGTRTRSSPSSPCTATCRAGRRRRSRCSASSARRCRRRSPTSWPRSARSGTPRSRAGRSRRRRSRGPTSSTCGGRGRTARSPGAFRRPATAPRPGPALGPAVLGRPLALGAPDDPSSPSAATTGRWRGATPRRAARSWPTTCTSASRCRTPGTALSLVLAHGADGERRVTGVTLPGVPLVVAGSNGRVAWGFTNSEGDWADLVVLEPDPGESGRLPDPEGPREFERDDGDDRGERRRGGDAVVESRSGGPSSTTTTAAAARPRLGGPPGGRRQRRAWSGWRRRASLDEALALAPEAGIPHQNFVVADAVGTDRLDDHRPHPAARGARRPRAGLVGRRHERLGRLARARGVPADRRPAERPDLDGQRPRRGRGEAREGRRSAATTSVRGRGRSATASSPFRGATEDDMLRVQLDDRALFLARWQKLLLDTLTPDAVAAVPAGPRPAASSRAGAAGPPSTRWATASSAPSASA